MASPMSSALITVDLLSIAPMLIVAVWALLLMLSDAFAGVGIRSFQRRIALLGLGIAAVVVLGQFGDYRYDTGRVAFSGFLVVDQFALWLDFVILAIAAGVLAFAGDYNRIHRFEYGEQEPLLLMATFGVMMLAHAGDLLAVFLGIETMSIAVYVMVGARWNSRQSPEASLKYFLMGAVASGVLLMGMALLYGATGTTGLGDIANQISVVLHDWRDATTQFEANAAAPVDPLITSFAPAALLIPGVFFVLAGLLFKVSAVPFHMWTPDAYDGAPTPATAYMAAGVKLGAFAAMLKLMVGMLHVNSLVEQPYGWTTVVAVIAGLTMTVGNLAAVRQPNVKRMLAYSSVAHVGYLLVGVVAAANFYGQVGSVTHLMNTKAGYWAQATGDLAIASILFYLVSYAVATLGCFACIAWYSRHHDERLDVDEWNGLAERHPGMALGMTIGLLSLLGMPPLGGFVGKLALFRAALENGNMTLRILVVLALLNSVVGAYYYLRLVVAMYFRRRDSDEDPSETATSASVVVAIAAAASLLLGIGAGPIMQRCSLAAAGFGLPVGSVVRAEWVDRMRVEWELGSTTLNAGGVATATVAPLQPSPPQVDEPPPKE